MAGVAEMSHHLEVFSKWQYSLCLGWSFLNSDGQDHVTFPVSCCAVPPVIASRGGTVTVLVNEPARLECEATGVPLPSLTWLKDGSPVASVLHGLQVVINSHLIQMYHVMWVLWPYNMVTHLWYLCQRVWFTSHSQVLSEGRVLSLHSALVSDTGTYTCVAVNAGGEQQRQYDLRVYGESSC